MSTTLRLGLENAAVCGVIAAIVALINLFVRRRPALTHVLWLLVLLKLVTPPLWLLPIDPIATIPQSSAGFVHEPQYEMIAKMTVDDEEEDSPALMFIDENDLANQALILESDASVVVASSAESGWTFASLLPWGLPVVATLWLAGSAATLVIGLIRVLRFQRFLRLAEPVESEVADRVALVAEQLGLRRPPRTVWIWGDLAPLIWSAGGPPLLVLPEPLWKRLDADQRDTLLAHELAHLKRRDHWVRWLEMAATILYWWFPALWWTRRALREAEEQCCDAWVVWAFPKGARAYAETLLETVDYLSAAATPMPAGASGFGHVRRLKRRLMMIMRGKTSRNLGWSGVVSSFSLAAVLLPFGPTWAESPDAVKPRLIQIEARENPNQPAVATTFSVAADTTTAQAEPVQSTATINVIAKGEDGKPVEFVVTGDDVRGPHPFASAIDRLTSELKSLQDKKGEESNRERIEVLEKAIKSLKAAVADESLLAPQRRIVIERRTDVASKDVKERPVSEAEQKEIKAQIERLRKQIDERTRQVKEANDQLHKAHMELSELNHQLARLEGKAVRVIAPYSRSQEIKVLAPLNPNRAMTFTARNPNQEERLNQVEKKLERILDELKHLRDKESDKR